MTSLVREATLSNKDKSNRADRSSLRNGQFAMTSSTLSCYFTHDKIFTLYRSHNASISDVDLQWRHHCLFNSLLDSFYRKSGFFYYWPKYLFTLSTPFERRYVIGWKNLLTCSWQDFLGDIIYSRSNKL